MLPILFTLEMPWGPQPIYSYGVLLGLSLVVGYFVTAHVGVRMDGLREDLLGGAYVTAAVSGLAGARLLYVLENRERFAASEAAWFDIASGGVAAYGGFLGGLVGAAAYLGWKRASLAAFADAAAPALALGTLLARIGCYLYGCDFGTLLPASAPGWLKALGTFPRWHYDAIGIFGSPAFLHHVDVYGLAGDAPASLPVHPTQLYEALAAAALLAFAFALLGRRRFRGQVILALAIGYGGLRFAFEYVRDDPERGHALGFSGAQLISLVLVPVCALLYGVRATRTRRGAA
jgi:phosphatidylglycerol---prolipoprotein diacylglyceryl transferase